MEIIREKSRSELDTFFIQSEGKRLTLYSKYDPQKDVIRDFKNFEYKKNCTYILMGTGIYHLKELMSNKEENSRVFLYDKSSIIDEFEKEIDEKVGIFNEENFDELLELVAKNPKKNIEIINFKPLVKLDSIFYNKVIEIIREIIEDAKDIPESYFEIFEGENSTISEEIKKSVQKKEYSFEDYIMILTKEMMTTYTRRDLKYEKQ